MKMPLEEFVYIHENEEITLCDYLNGNMNIDYEGTGFRTPCPTDKSSKRSYNVK